MAKINANFLKLQKSYLFVEIARRVNDYKAANPNNKIIRMGIGDVTLPLAPSVVSAMENAVREMGRKETFRGYEDSGLGYDFLREAVSGYYKNSIGVDIDVDEILISDGAKSDCGNFGDIFAADNTVLLTDPVYPVYFDANIMAGREIKIIDATPENNFAPKPPSDGTHADIIYLCSPGNPTGAVYTRPQLTQWVEYAQKNNAVIIYDAAYEAFISEADIPRSIFSIPGARSCAVEICSLSKTAGFTGTRLGYTVIPKELTFEGGQSVLDTWKRRQGSKFNGVSYPVQRGAEAVFTAQGQKEIKETIRYYARNAKVMTDAFSQLGIPFTGGVNSPYVWFDTGEKDSWDCFDELLTKAEIVGTPGGGFGKNGVNRLRLTAFNTYENTAAAMERIKKLFS